MARTVDMDMTAEPSEFVEAVTEFAARRVVTREEADALSAYARKRVWWISGVTQMDVVNDAHASIAKAIADGTTFDEWKKTAGPKLEKAWGRKDSPRILTIFRNATTSAYNAGRLEQMEEPHIVAVRPFKMFDVVDDERTSETCHPYIKPPVILPWDDPWWLSHSPPLHHRCRSGIRSLRKSVAERKGIMATPPADKIADGWGVDPRLAEPPKPSEREKQPDPDLQTECAVKGGQYLRESKPVTIPKRLLKKTA